MQPAVPLVRTLGHAVTTCSTSRIPHLEYHLVRKLSRSRKSAQHPQRVRHRSTLADPDFPSAPWSQAIFPANGDDDAGRRDPLATTAPSNANAQQHGSQARQGGAPHLPLETTQVCATRTEDELVSSLLEEAHPERLLSFLSHTQLGGMFIASATNEDFERAFCALDPQVLVEPFKLRQKNMRVSALVEKLGLNIRVSLVERLRTFAQTMDAILLKRKQSGAELTLPVYRQALRCAASAGDRKMADAIWNDLTAARHMDPDLDCYNAYMKACLDNLAYSERASASFRAHRQNLDWRSKQDRPKALRGYSVGARESPELGSALRAQMLVLFQSLSDQGLQPNEETFTSLMVAFGRSGDTASVDSVLKSVWNIDVGALSNFDEEELESPTFYPESSPLRPTGQLLHAIVHAYGAGHDVAKAWLLLDYTSRNYAMDIPESVWTDMFSWAYVHSVRRSRSKRERGHAAGQIPLQELDVLYHKMIDVPFNVPPNAVMLNLLAKNYVQRRLLDRTLDVVRRAEQQLQQEVSQLQTLVDAVKRHAINPHAVLADGIPSADFLRLRQQFALTYLEVLKQYDYLRRQVMRIVKENDWPGSGNAAGQGGWQRRKLPNVIAEFAVYVPHAFPYKTSTGSVWFRTAGPWERPANDLAAAVLVEASSIWHALFHGNLLEAFEQSPNSLLR